MTTTKTIPTWTVGDRLAKARRLMGWSQQRMADELGISIRTVVRLEDQTTAPKRPVLIAWAELTGVPLEWLTDEGVTAPVTLRYHGQTCPPTSSPQVSGPGHPQAA